MQTTYAFNPPASGRKRKARKTRRVARRRSRLSRGPAGRFRPRRKSRKASRSRSRIRAPKRHYARKGRRRKSRKGRRRSQSRGYAIAVVRTNPAVRSNSGKRRRRNGSRRSNPGLSLAGTVIPPVLPFGLSRTNIVSRWADYSLQGLALGAGFVTGYFGSGALVDLAVPRQKAAEWAAAGDWKGKVVRPALFTLLTGLTAGAVGLAAKFAKFKSPGAMAIAAGCGPGVRALCGTLAAFMPQGVDETGFLADLKRGFVGISDYVTIGDAITVQMVRDEPSDEEDGGMGAVVPARTVRASAGNEISGDGELDDNGMN